MKKKSLILFLIPALFSVGCAPIPPTNTAIHPPAGFPVPHPPQVTNSAEAAAAAEAGIIAVGVGLTVLDIILSTQGHRSGVRARPMRHHPRR